MSEQQQLETGYPKRAPERKRGGRWVAFGEELLQVPPLSLGSVVELQDDVDSLKGLTGKPTPAQMGVISKIVHAALSRNYPGMTVEEVGEMVDLGNYMEVINAVLSIAGYAKGPQQPGGAAAAEAGGPPTSP